ncbi:hypothetical protein QQ045_017560 [Rhodiola kirilowii]
MSQLCRQVCFVVSTLLFFVACIKADTQAENLRGLLSSKWSKNPPLLQKWADLDHTLENYLVPQGGSMQDDKIVSLPGQPEGVDFDQYAGYVTIDEQVGKALFYYFVESPQDSSTKPLLLWLNGGGGSGCAFSPSLPRVVLIDAGDSRGVVYGSRSVSVAVALVTVRWLFVEASDLFWWWGISCGCRW